MQEEARGGQSRTIHGKERKEGEGEGTKEEEGNTLEEEAEEDRSYSPSKSCQKPQGYDVTRTVM